MGRLAGWGNKGRGVVDLKGQRKENEMIENQEHEVVSSFFGLHMHGLVHSIADPAQPHVTRQLDSVFPIQ